MPKACVCTECVNWNLPILNSIFPVHQENISISSTLRSEDYLHVPVYLFFFTHKKHTPPPFQLNFAALVTYCFTIWCQSGHLSQQVSIKSEFSLTTLNMILQLLSICNIVARIWILSDFMKQL